MKTTNQKKIIIGVAVAVVVIVIVAAVSVFLMNGSQKNAPSAAGNNPQTTNTPAPAAPVTRLPVPTNVVVPEAGAQNLPADVAVPKVESVSAPGADTKYRSFNIIVQNGQFLPSTIAVNLGDTVNLQIGAVGGDYDFTQPDYGLKVSLPDGESKQTGFEATAAGKFVFYCSSCGGPAKGPVGYLIVTGK
jgi:heme/copper-type cytochrome/quinol oxidase subunit 2